MNRKLVNGESVVEKLTNRIHPWPIQSFKISGPRMVFRLALPTFPWVKKSRGSAGEPTEKGAVERSQAQNNREILDKSREKIESLKSGIRRFTEDNEGQIKLIHLNNNWHPNCVFRLPLSAGKRVGMFDILGITLIDLLSAGIDRFNSLTNFHRQLPYLLDRNHRNGE